MGVTISERLRRWVLRGLVKASVSTLVPTWIRESFIVPTFRAMSEEGFRANAAVFACISELCFAFPEPPLVVQAPGPSGWETVPATHPLVKLLANPYEGASTSDMLRMVMLYLAIGGNCYLYKVRSRGKQVVRLLPLSDAQIQPVAGGTQLVGHYTWQGAANEMPPGMQKDVPVEDVIHLQWLPDPLAPWKGLAPLVAVAREVDTDNEATRYLYALLKNDAMPRVAITIPETLDPDMDRLREQWSDTHGGEKRGGVGILEPGMTIQRLGLNLQELAMEALRKVPEARIAASFRVPPVIVGLNVGLEQSTYNNVEGMKRYFVQDRMQRMWRYTEEKLTVGLVVEFGLDNARLRCAFDRSGITALSEDAAIKRKDFLSGYTGGVVTKNEARTAFGLAVLSGQDGFAPPASTPGEVIEAAFRVIAGQKMLPPGRKAQAAPSVDEATLKRAAKRWDKAMPKYEGLLNATEEGAAAPTEEGDHE